MSVVSFRFLSWGVPWDWWCVFPASRCLIFPPALSVFAFNLTFLMRHSVPVNLQP